MIKLKIEKCYICNVQEKIGTSQAGKNWRLQSFSLNVDKGFFQRAVYWGDKILKNGLLENADFMLKMEVRKNQPMLPNGLPNPKPIVDTNYVLQDFNEQVEEAPKINVQDSLHYNYAEQENKELKIPITPAQKMMDIDEVFKEEEEDWLKDHDSHIDK